MSVESLNHYKLLVRLILYIASRARLSKVIHERNCHPNQVVSSVDSYGISQHT